MASRPANQSRSTWAEVDLSAFRHNIRTLHQHVGNHRGFFATIKSNGYGHGLAEMANAALEANATTLAVATADEGHCLRDDKRFQSIPILVYGPVEPHEVADLVHHDLSFAVGNASLLREAFKVAHKVGKPPRIHYQIDTGMGRDGSRPDDMEFMDVLMDEGVGIEGLWTHLAVSDCFGEDDVAFTRSQVEKLKSVAAAMKKAGYTPTVHAANSGGVLYHKDSWLDAVRPGISLYGPEAGGFIDRTVPLRQVMTLRSSLCAIKTMKKGDTISYGRTWEVPSERPIGIVPIGYGDGYMRCLGNKMEVLVHGKRVPIRGRVCMDQFMVDLSEVPKATVSDEVVIYGSHGNKEIRLEEAAEVAGTIPYELTCILTSRVPRVYTDREKHND